MSIIEEMVGNVVSKRFEDFDKETVDYAKIRIIDTIGGIVGGANSTGCPMILDLVRAWGGKKESTILAHGIKVPAANAAMVMGIMARSNDFEPAGGPDIDGKRYTGHYSATSVSTALAVTEQRGASGKELITALILGDDMATRIGVAGTGGPRSWDSSGICNRFAATAIAGKLGGLSENQIVNAMGIVLNQIGGTMQATYDYVHSFKIHQGLAAWAGILSAELASRGFTGPKDPLFSQFGYFKLYCHEVNPSVLTKQLGKRFYADTEFKPYPCCRGNHTVIDAALKLVHDNTIKPEDINKVTVDLRPRQSTSFLVQPFIIGDVPQAIAILNIRYNVANAILRKSVKLEHYTEEFIRDPNILELVKKTDITFSLPPEGKPHSTRVSIQMKDGREFSAFVETAKGDMDYDPLTKEEIRDKFRASIAFSKLVSQENGEKALNMLDRLEDVNNIAEIIKLLK